MKNYEGIFIATRRVALMLMFSLRQWRPPFNNPHRSLVALPSENTFLISFLIHRGEGEPQAEFSSSHLMNFLLKRFFLACLSRK